MLGAAARRAVLSETPKFRKFEDGFGGLETGPVMGLTGVVGL